MLNLTQHIATPEQKEAGVVDLIERRGELIALLTFEELPTRVQVRLRACKIAELAAEMGANEALIGGAPFLMSSLQRELSVEGIIPYYAFSIRESVEEAQPDGSVRKTNVFRHAGFIPAV